MASMFLYVSFSSMPFLPPPRTATTPLPPPQGIVLLFSDADGDVVYEFAAYQQFAAALEPLLLEVRGGVGWGGVGWGRVPVSHPALCCKW